MAKDLSVDADAWEDHARWWDGESRRAAEAMDVSEDTLTAARDGRVAEVLARAGDQVEAGAPLIRLEEDEA